MTVIQTDQPSVVGRTASVEERMERVSAEAHRLRKILDARPETNRWRLYEEAKQTAVEAFEGEPANYEAAIDLVTDVLGI